MKNCHLKAIFFIFFTFLSAGFMQSQNDNGLWGEIAKEEISQELLSRKSDPNRATFFELNIQEIKNQLSNAPSRDTFFGESQVVVRFPNSQGQLSEYRIKEASIFAQELQEEFPNIRSYIGESINNTSETVRFSISQKGLHAMFFNTKTGLQFIDPYTVDGNKYVSYSKSELPTLERELFCEVEESVSNDIDLTSRMNDGSLRTYRLALACTGEYGVFHGGTVAGALAAMNTTMTRVNGIFEKELSLTMELVGNNTQVIFTNPATDPFDGNDDAFTLIVESQTEIDARIGNANYDIGHTFSTGGGGLATQFGPCNAGSKARGITGSPSPMGDSYDVDFVAHEIGHQFGANHTFNGDAGNCAGEPPRNNDTAYEPGSGSTIMAYAGICTPENVQNNSDAYFHVVSLEEMWANISSGPSSGCAAITSSGNSNSPTINSLTNYTIPKSTPFILKGNGNDADGNGTLTYCWEQKDNEITAVPLVSTAPDGPAFRSLTPSNSSDRYMPAIATVIAGNTQSEWEVVSSVARTMNFDLTVRDNIATGGRYTTESMIVTFEDVTPFTVTFPNAQENWAVASSQTITWEVGSTTNGTINCQNVNIKLSTDGGFTYPITILTNTPNDGSQSITIPNNLSTTCRIMVEAADNIFYDISNEDFIISTTGGTTSYCPSTYTNVGSEFISNVTFSTIDNSSVDATTNGYEDFLSEEANVEASTSYNIDVTINTAGNFTDHCNVFIDWNQNFVFEPATELYDLGDVTNVTAGVLNGSIMIPSNALNGTTRMRVSIEANNDPGACDSNHIIEWGETEDYSVTITGGLSVSEEILQEFVLYPNPTKGTVNASLKLDSTEKVKVDLIDLLGKTIKTTIFTTDNLIFSEELKYENLSKGLYFIKITQKNKTTSKQLIIN
jgi:hypothetical protein|tara:strand:+ start:414 stop:3113 length:2700 start_codon:yes stop_codon:yes gene_type:complete